MRTDRLHVVLLILGLLAAGCKPARSQGKDVEEPVLNGPYYALLIGNNDYRHLPKLGTAVADASAMAALLHGSFGFTSKVLLNATRGEVLSALARYRATLPENSSLLIYYAGHGEHDRDTDVTYWLLVDAERADNSNWISNSDITSAIRAIPSRHILVISDSCYAGAIHDVDMRNTATFVSDRDAEGALANSLRKKSRTLLASGADEPVADAGGDGHSIFAQALLDGLRETQGSRFTANYLYVTFVKRRVGGRLGQDPQYYPLFKSGDAGGEFVFSRRAATPMAAATRAAIVENADLSLITDYGETLEERIAKFEGYKRLSAGGDVTAMAKLAEMYRLGAGTSRDEGEAERLFRRAAEGGSPDGMIDVGYLYLKGGGELHTEKNEAEAKRWFHKAAEAGAGQDMGFDGDTFDELKEYDEAVWCYRIAAKAGNPDSMRGLGLAYEFGQGVAQDSGEAVRWYRKGADAGDPLSMHFLGQSYYSGRGIGKDPVQAALWYRKAADAGLSAAMDDLGTAYMYGLGVKQDGAEAFRWYRKAVDAGSGRGMLHLGQAYAMGNGAPKDLTESKRLFQQAENSGDTSVLESLAFFADSGGAEPLGLSDVARLLRKGADAGDPSAMEYLAELYEEGRLVPKEYGEAIRWYRKAAEDGYAPGMYRLGQMYEKGLGVKASRSEALSWYEKAARNGYPAAAESIKRLR